MKYRQLPGTHTIQYGKQLILEKSKMSIFYEGAGQAYQLYFW